MLAADGGGVASNVGHVTLHPRTSLLRLAKDVRLVTLSKARPLRKRPPPSAGLASYATCP